MLPKDWCLNSKKSSQRHHLHLETCHLVFCGRLIYVFWNSAGDLTQRLYPTIFDLGYLSEHCHDLNRQQGRSLSCCQ
ncbi:hypothetical protein AALO_G00246770 [Alosa alosa]|uniref:Uncharacterized protein n=1 Tax=Alosa alosa TaxID=278164 RepID=A0AAV6FSY3_9TELE|nr:hypothetical protein AALO_G00246770 [Alosa alosa]